jgi:hypothetical protein
MWQCLSTRRSLLNERGGESEGRGHYIYLSHPDLEVIYLKPLCPRLININNFSFSHSALLLKSLLGFYPDITVSVLGVSTIRRLSDAVVLFSILRKTHPFCPRTNKAPFRQDDKSSHVDIWFNHSLSTKGS